MEYLAYLIKSLENVKGIAEALLIFSHDVYDANVNQLVQSIKYCRVIQVTKNYWPCHGYTACKQY